MGSVTFGGQFTVVVIWALSGFAYEAHSKQTEMIKQTSEAVETRSDTSTPAGLRTKQPVAVLNSKGCHGDISWVRVSPGHPHHRHLSITGWTVIDSSALEGAWECYTPPQPYSRHCSSNSFCSKGMLLLLGLIFFLFLILNFPSHRIGGTSWTKGAGGHPNMFESEGDLMPPLRLAQ